MRHGALGVEQDLEEQEPQPADRDHDREQERRARAARVSPLRLLAVGASLALAALASALVAPATARALSKKIEMIRSEIETRGKVTEVVIEDLDGDGRKDLLLVLGREVRVHFQGDNGRFSTEPDQRFRIDPRASVFDVGDVSGTGKKDLCFLRDDGVYAYPLRPGETKDAKPFYELRAKRLVAASTILRQPSEDEVRRKEFLRDVNGDGKVDAIVPERTGFAVYMGEGAGRFGARQPIPSPPTSLVDLGSNHVSSRLMGSYFFANPTVADFDADGRPDVVLAREKMLEVWKTTPEGKIDGTPALSLEIPGQKAFTMDAEKPFDLDFTMPLLLKDLNHDGRVDAALTHVGTGTTRVFLNGPDPKEAFRNPTRVVRAKGVTFLAFFVDLDGDGLEDMVLPRMDKIGIWSILKIIVTRSVPVEAQVFYQRKEGPAFPEEPDFQRSFEIPIAIHSKGDGLDVGTSIVASLDGDFDGDGLKDLLYRTEASKLAIFRGLPGRKGLDDKAAAELDIPSAEDYRFILPAVEDLNSDGRADVVLRFFSWDRKDDRVVVFVSR